MTQDLRGNTNTNAISQQRCCHPVADVMYPQIGTPEHARQTGPLLSVENGRYATLASEDPWLSNVMDMNPRGAIRHSTMAQQKTWPKVLASLES